jgi:hypothetical protein
MDFFKNGVGWCRRHDSRPKAQAPRRKSQAPIFRAQALKLKLAETVKPKKINVR